MMASKVTRTRATNGENLAEETAVPLSDELAAKAIKLGGDHPEIVAALEQGIVEQNERIARVEQAIAGMAEKVTTRSLVVVDGNGKAHIVAGAGEDWGSISVTARAETMETFGADGPEVSIMASEEDVEPRVYALARLGCYDQVVGALGVGVAADAGSSLPSSPESRIAALEAEVAELRAYIPMLARMAFHEHWTNRSIPEHIEQIEDVVLCSARHAINVAQAALNYGDERCSTSVQDAPPEFCRPDGEPIPTAAQRLQEEYDRRN